MAQIMWGSSWTATRRTGANDNEIKFLHVRHIMQIPSVEDLARRIRWSMQAKQAKKGK
jgi:hypothetical protein